ncbi:MAG: metallophosphoesterase [Sedimentisphaerales bacterium]|nr:metallophosphoesterase [Sedimentisphaerales bacterium]
MVERATRLAKGKKLELTQAIVIYNVLTLILVLGQLWLLARLKPRRPIPAIAALGALLVALTSCGAFLSPIEGFGRIQLLTWAVFVHYPLFLIGVGILCRNRAISYLCAALTVCIAVVGLDAFLIEPRWIEVTRFTISSTELETPVRVAVIADLQTDRIGRYEERIFELTMAEQPDLILLAGDYLHVSDEAEYEALKTELNALMQQAHLDAPLGVFAVQGNIDWGDWTELFAGLPVTTFETTSSLDLGPVALTGLTMGDSANPALSLGDHEKFHIVLGHVPNYSLGSVEADLLIAGHTHGGQVQIPFLGPVFTLSEVPRSWASGMTSIAPGRHLIVSRGIGMERGNAPRLRFLCRPELLILELVP